MVPMRMHTDPFRSDDLSQSLRLLFQPQHVGIKTPAMCHHQCCARFIRSFAHLLKLVGIHSHRLFHHHMHTCIQRGDRLWCVQIIWGGNNQRIHTAFFQQCIHGLILSRNAELFSKLDHRVDFVIYHCRQFQPQILRSLSVDLLI